MSYETTHDKVYLGKGWNVLNQYEGAEMIELQFVTMSTMPQCLSVSQTNKKRLALLGQKY